jgi:formylglycine-generating enzyme
MRVVILALLVAFAASFVSAGEVPGLVKDKPASGPFVETDRGYMVPYTATIPGTGVTFEMIPIPGGEFLLGSPDSEPGRDADEGPQVRVTTRPFWMQKNEIRWIEYKEFMALYNIFKKFEAGKIRLVTDTNTIDVITAPTELYEPTFTFEFGEDPELPAVSMTLYAARQYTKWMSAVTGQQYRVPTEAEWEYAAEGGSKTAYSFGDDPNQLAAYGWSAETSKDTGPRKVGLGKSNAYGLCDMHGNVAEWVQDEYHADGYAGLKDQIAAAKGQPLSVFTVLGKPTVHDSRVVCGGSWQDPAEGCRSASRIGSNYSEWKDTDPNLPKSPWWMTDDPCRGIGFRMLRSIDELPREQIEQFWNIDSESLQLDVDGRIPGRGVYGLVDKDLPQAVKALKASEK